MTSFEHVRHKPASELDEERELIVVCPTLKSRINLSRIVRAAGCFGVRKIIAGRPFSIDADVARDAADYVTVVGRQSIPPVLKQLKRDGFSLVGLEQTTESVSLYDIQFPKKMALVLGHERNGIDAESLALLDQVAEIPVFGQPLSFNVATAATMGLYEYCRQHNPTPGVSLASPNGD